MRGLVYSFLLFLFTTSGSAQQVFLLKYLESPAGENLLLESLWVPGQPVLEKGITEVRYPAEIAEHLPLSKGWIVELYGNDEDLLWSKALSRKVVSWRRAEESGSRDEVITLVSNGPPDNRIDLVILGDGYTLAERDKFFEDARRITEDMFVGQTFNSYLPLFNVHAVFRASKESGIGVRDRPKDTAFGLFRVGDTLREIRVSNDSAARDSCRQAPGCDYPILMGNDPFYGGLGGEFAITTSSKTSGTVVLRHELGHNFGRVGEEYDGGSAYFGQNFAYSTFGIGWKHWMEGSENSQPSKARYIGWPWHLLSQGPFKFEFVSDGSYASYQFRYSVSGIETEDTLEVTLDGIPFEPQSSGIKDRVFFTIERESGFPAGKHTIQFKEKVADGDNWVSNVDLSEYKANYNFTDSHVGVYPLFGQRLNVIGYRPTHETCLMRNMVSRQFCSVCQENNWDNFFRKVSVLDKLNIQTETDTVKVSAQTPDLGQFRQSIENGGAWLHLAWFQNGEERKDLSDKREWELSKSDAKGNWELKMEFKSPEIRKAIGSGAKATKRFSL